MIFHLIPKDEKNPDSGAHEAYLHIDHWNDYAYVTMFYLSLYDDKGVLHDIGNVKIGFIGQTTDKPTYEMIGVKSFDHLPEGYFSLGTDVDYYHKLLALPKTFREEVLRSLNDMVFDQSHLDIASEEGVFGTSLLRNVSLSVIKGQFSRVLDGEPPLTDFKFSYRREADERMSAVNLDFVVVASSKPSTNIHTLIGRNGVGKTTLLNGMIEAITNREESAGKIFNQESWQEASIGEDYFSSLVSVSFSAFDPFKPPREQPDPSKGTCYFYIGLRKIDAEEGDALKIIPDLHIEFINSLKSCLSQTGKKERWKSAITSLESDENFAEMQLLRLAEYTGKELVNNAKSLIERMSSGHAIVLLTITQLVARVEEKTLVLIDEPESHLHPPLLSAFIRSLNELLNNRNGVAIIATHSPVVLQEVPKTCVWKINRSGLEMKSVRPEEETFGENVGTLTREVFGLEVVKSGFHNLLVKSVESGSSYDELLDEYNHQLGYEAKAILKALIIDRDKGN